MNRYKLHSFQRPDTALQVGDRVIVKKDHIFSNPKGLEIYKNVSGLIKEFRSEYKEAKIQYEKHLPYCFDDNTCWWELRKLERIKQ